MRQFELAPRVALAVVLPTLADSALLASIVPPVLAPLASLDLASTVSLGLQVDFVDLP